jgi:hypothetical protein
MVSKLKILKIVYPDIQMYQRDAAKLRGFFANKHEDDDIFHNHLGHTFRYEYPKIQYKVLYGKPTIIAFGIGIPAAYKSVLEENEIDIGGETIHVAGMKIDMYEAKVGDCDSILAYQFASPWLALNQKNYTAYMQRKTDEDKKALLENILIGNILSMFKSLQIRLENRIAVSAELYKTPVNFKNESMLGFYGKFTVNCRLPSYFGIGKSVSRGFGTILGIQTPKNPEKAGKEDVEGI